MRKNGLAAFKERGYFWLHGTPMEERWLAPAGAIAGTLSVDDEGHISLDLDGVLSVGGPLSPRPSSQMSPPIQGILKESEGGGDPHVLLVGLYLDGEMLRSGGITYEKYVAEKCIRSNIAFPPCNGNIKYTSLSIDLASYEEWLGVHSINVDLTDAMMVATYTERAADKYELEGGGLDIVYGCRGSWHSYALDWTQTAKAIFTFNVALDLDKVLEMYDAFQDLLILLTDGHHGLEWPGLTASNNARCRCYFFRNRNLDKPMSLISVPLLFVNIRDHFGDIWLAWLRFRAEKGPGAYLYLGTRKGIGLYPENRFVNLIWGIESLHRRNPPNSSRTAGGRERKVQKILDALSKSDKDTVSKSDVRWLRRQLRHAGEPSLEERIYDAFQSLPLNIENSNLRAYAKRCAKRRNDISHYGGDRDDGDYREFLEGLINETEALSILYHAYLLHAIGISGDVLVHWIHTGPQSFHRKGVLAANGLIAPEKDGAPAL